ncbi:MAG: hypothetical protein JO341_02455, partial [Gammaproteobacteria bacterium]|nr:hypothetical protein [Gammaproteobacteria bacterium]
PPAAGELSPWLQLMLEEIRAKREARAAAQAEEQQRATETASPAVPPARP